MHNFSWLNNRNQNIVLNDHISNLKKSVIPRGDKDRWKRSYSMGQFMGTAFWGDCVTLLNKFNAHSFLI